MPDQQVHVETHDVGTQTFGTDRRKALESEPDLRLGSRGENNEANATLPEDNHGSQVDSLALTLFRPSQHNDLELEQLTADQGPQDILLGDHTNVLEEINQENIRLRLQRDDLLGQCTVLESDLSASFMEKMDLANRLSSAERTIEKGRAYYERSEAEWKRDHAKLQDMTRLFEANAENERFVEMLGQQNLLEETNAWLFGQLQMKTEDNRFFACQREAVVRASSYDRVCAMTSEIEMLRQCLSTVKAQLADSDKAKKRLAEELQQERLKHRATRKAVELKTNMGSFPYNAQQTMYAGGSAPHKPSKFTSTYPSAFQAPLPEAGTPPQFLSERKSESIFGANPFFEPSPASSSIAQQYGTRSKSKFSFGDTADSESASTATGTTTGPTSRTDFNFTFGGTTNHHSSPSGYGSTPGLDLSKESTSPANIFVASTFSADAEQTTTAQGLGNCKTSLVERESPPSFNEHDHSKDGGNEKHLQDPCLPAGSSYTASKLSAEVTDNVDLLEGLAPKTIAENKGLYNFAKSADFHVNQKAKKGAKKPLASDFFDEDPVQAEVEMATMDALAAEKISEGKVTIVAAGADVAQNTPITGGAHHSATAESNTQAGEDNKTKSSEQDKIPLSPTPTLELPAASSEGLSKQPKNKGKTSRRAFLRKVAKERKRAAIGEADWSETS